MDVANVVNATDKALVSALPDLVWGVGRGAQGMVLGSWGVGLGA